LNSVDINSAFLDALEYSDIPGEDWGTFPTRIGDKYLTANPRQIYANARVYYSSHFVHKRLEQATAAAIATVATAASKPIAVVLDKHSLWVLAINNRGNRTMHGRGRGRGWQCKEYPTDPNGYCTFHRRAGYTTEQCRACLQPSTTDIRCYNCNKFGHKSPDCPEHNRYVPSSVLPTPTSMPTPLPKEPIQPQVALQIRVIRTPTFPAHPSEEQPRIRIIHTPMSGIAAHPFNASDDITSDTLIFNTACTHHMVHNHELFHNYNQFPTPIAVCGIRLREHLAYGQGTLHIAPLHNGLASNEHHLRCIWYIPEMDINISKSWTKRCGLKVKMNDNEDFVITNDKGMCLQMQDIAGHSYIMNLFVQPFHSHAIVHAVVASEP
jgi:Pol polyprotein, beta-barrel domain/Zinc knuckle